MLLKNVGDINEKMIQKGFFLLKSLLYNGNKKCIVYLTTCEKAHIFHDVLTGLLNLLNTECEIHMITNKTTRVNLKFIVFNRNILQNMKKMAMKY